MFKIDSNIVKSKEFSLAVLFFLFVLSLFVSKSGISIFGTLLFLIYAPSYFKEQLKKPTLHLYFCVGFFLLALLGSFFSLGGKEAALNVVTGWPYLLYSIPFLYVFRSKMITKAVVFAILAGITLANFNSLFKFIELYPEISIGQTRIDSFWQLTRWGFLLSLVIPVLLAGIDYLDRKSDSKSDKILKYFVVFCLYHSLFSLLMASTRASWLGAVFGVVLYFMFRLRSMKWFIPAFVVLPILVLSAPSLNHRVMSIFNAKPDLASAKIVSTDQSNEGRLNMWAVGLMYIKQQNLMGTGFESTEGPLKQYFATNPELEAKYLTSQFSFTDQHNAYLGMYMQFGAILFVIFFGFYFYLSVLHLVEYFKYKSGFSLLVFISSGVFLFGCIFNSVTLSYEVMFITLALPLIKKLRGDLASSGA